MIVLAAMVIFASGCGAQTDGKKGKLKKSKGDLVLLSTEFGDMKIMLYDETPIHKENFLKLVKEGAYDGSTFHRVIQKFMIQGGSPKTKINEDGTPMETGETEHRLPAEFVEGLYHKKGAVAAARQGDGVNPEKKSSGYQFYIVQGKPFNNNQLAGMEKRSGITYTDEQKEVYNTIGGTPHLDGSYTVFGEVIEGLEVIDKIAAVQTDSRDKPLEDVRMTMTVVKK